MLKNPDDVIKAIECCCDDDGPQCSGCAYRDDDDCVTKMDLDALAFLKKYQAYLNFIRRKP